MLNDKRWRKTKEIVWERAHGLCEWCRRDGIEAGVLPNGWVRAGVDCHHLVPFESASTNQEAERLCYDPNNVVLLCIEHHIKAHADAGSHTKEAHKLRADEKLKRWIERHRK